MKRFKCGLCNKKKVKVYVGTRRGLRNHIKKDHVILSEITNQKFDKNDRDKSAFKQRWWIDEEVPYGM